MHMHEHREAHVYETRGREQRGHPWACCRVMIVSSRSLMSSPPCACATCAACALRMRHMRRVRRVRHMRRVQALVHAGSRVRNKHRNLRAGLRL